MKNNDEYIQVRLYYKNLKSKTFRVHQLVAYMFINNENMLNNDIKNIKGILLKRQINDGYCNIALICFNNENKKESHSFRVHGLVAYIFIKTPEIFNENYGVHQYTKYKKYFNSMRV